jgi:sulfite exporter TauE/SafE
VSGLVLVVLGLQATGLFRLFQPSTGRNSCLATTLFAAFLTDAGWVNVFVAGLLNGLLPCGLVYAYLAMAASSGDLLHGAAIMSLFGLGTIPAMVLTGYSGLFLSLSIRRYVFRAAAWCVVLTGLLCVMRGLGFTYSSQSLDRPSCIWCP